MANWCSIKLERIFAHSLYCLSSTSVMSLKLGPLHYRQTSTSGIPRTITNGPYNLYYKAKQCNGQQVLNLVGQNIYAVSIVFETMHCVGEAHQLSIASPATSFKQYHVTNLTCALCFVLVAHYTMYNIAYCTMCSVRKALTQVVGLIYALRKLCTDQLQCTSYNVKCKIVKCAMWNCTL